MARHPNLLSSGIKALPLVFLLAACGSGSSDGPGMDTPESPTARLAQEVGTLYSGDRAYETVAFLDQFVRWPGNRGFDASIHHIVERLEAAGYVNEASAAEGDRLTYRLEHYPMEQPAWEPVGARVMIEGLPDPVLEFATNRNMVARGSNSTPRGGVTARLLDLGRATPEDFEATDVKGAIVLADMSVGRLYTEAVVRRGAIGVLGYSLPDYLRPEVNQQSIQFGSIQAEPQGTGWGISLSYEARARLRDALASGPVQVTVETQVVWTPNADELTVVADVAGSTLPDERFVFSAHVQEPGANDNASGVGAQVEMARVAAELVRSGRVDPARTITFLWGLEIRSTARYIEQDSTRATGIRWGLSLDMVGEDTDKTGGTFLIEKMPDPSAIWTRGEDRHTEWGGRPLSQEDMVPHYFNDFVLNRAREQAVGSDWFVGTNPYEGGSDHVPFLRAGIPGLLLWHFTDQFYHTDRDRLEMVSAEELGRVGRLALVSALALTTADGHMARALVDEVTREAVNRLDTETRLSVLNVSEAPAPRDSTVAAELQILDAWDSWYRAALDTALDIEVGGSSDSTRARIESSKERVLQAREDAERQLGRAADA